MFGRYHRLTAHDYGINGRHVDCLAVTSVANRGKREYQSLGALSSFDAMTGGKRQKTTTTQPDDAPLSTNTLVRIPGLRGYSLRQRQARFAQQKAIRTQARLLLITTLVGARAPEKGAVGRLTEMENMQFEPVDPVVGRYCLLKRPVRDRDGVNHFNEKPKVLREVVNLDRRMFLVQFGDGSTTFLFPDEVSIE
jgi:hypothetical protein